MKAFPRDAVTCHFVKGIKASKREKVSVGCDTNWVEHVHTVVGMQPAVRARDAHGYYGSVLLTIKLYHSQ